MMWGETMNDDLRDTFHRWYPGMSRIETDNGLKKCQPEQYPLN